MKQRYLIFLFSCLFICLSFHAGAHSLWQQHDAKTAQKHATLRHFLLYSLDEQSLRNQLLDLPSDPAGGKIIELPLPDGSSRAFRVWSSPMLPPELAAKYPGLRTFTGEAVNNHTITAKLDVTAYGFHAVIYNGENTSFIDPDDDGKNGYYTVHYKRDEVRTPEQRTKCFSPQTPPAPARSPVAAGDGARTTNGYTLRTYRLALACDHDYAQAATGLTAPTIEQTFSKMITSMNRINGVYEREFAITMVFAENEDTLIWPVATGSTNGADPFTGNDSNAYQCLLINQHQCDGRIGNANYDIGHVFTTGAGGLSQVGVACEPGWKAQSVTGQPDPVGDGFDIDYVSHEMGHEYGAYHPFNNAMDGSCSSGTIYPPDAYEPGSGSTIMAYAGICAPDDLQPHSDPYFHSVSLGEIQSYINGAGDACPLKTPVGNKPAGIAPFSAAYTIPFLTPFELTAPVASDSVADTSITYCWEQMNLGDMGLELDSTHYSGPIFRSYIPVTSRTRIFPKDTMVLAGVLSNAGHEGDEGEKAADVARYLTFRLTVRDVYQGTGCFLIPDDTVHLDVINTGSGFTVTSQSIPGTVYQGSSTQMVTWNVVSTDIAPINTNSVDIYMSEDGGYTWPDTLGNFPNTGSASVTLPNPDSTVSAARIKVKGSGNVFFNVNSSGFKVVQDNGGGNSGSSAAENINVFPVPANSVLYITTGITTPLQIVIYNAIGQKVWKGAITGQDALPVSAWARGTYFLWASDTKNKHTVKKFVLE